MIKKGMLLLVIVLASCGVLPTPDDFPPPVTPIVEFPQVTATATLEPRLRPIVPNDVQEAATFLLILKTSMAAGNDTGIAELIKYPIHVGMNGQVLVFENEGEFLDQYEKIFDQEFITLLSDLDESDLLLLPDGIQAGNGALWFNFFCVDPACSDSQFLITQINN